MNPNLVFPDGHDRSRNDPCVLFSAASTKRLYEAKHGSPADGHPSYNLEKLQEYFKQESIKQNWTTCEFYGGQVLLIKVFL